MRSALLLLFSLTTHTSREMILHVYVIVTSAIYSGNDAVLDYSNIT